MGEFAGRVVEVPATTGSIEIVQDEFARWWAELGDGTPGARYAFETAIVEIAANIAEHTRRVEGSAGRGYRLELSADRDRLTAVFTDDGRPVEIDLSTVTMAEVDEESGRGLALAIAALESLDYRHVDGRNIWTLVCAR